MTEMLVVEEVDAGEGVEERRPIFGPDPSAWDPFLLWSYDRFGRGAFSWHPHKGFETVTLVLSGRLEHKDSLGGHGVLGPGDVQWMTAGSGILHSEEPADGEVAALQLWLNLPAAHKEAAPRVQDIPEADAAAYRDGALTARVYGGRLGDAIGPARQWHETLFATVRMSRGSGELPLTPGVVGCLYVLEGTVRVDGLSVAAGHAARLGGPCRLEADDGARAVVVAAMPLHQPVALHFPFVLSSEDEAPAAFAAYRAGAFGEPW